MSSSRYPPRKTQLTFGVSHSHVYGIDMPSPQELVAHNRTEEEVAHEIGADLVIYQTLQDLKYACSQWNPSIKTFDCSVFTGEYVTGGVDDRYLAHLAKLRNDKAKAKKKQSTIEEKEVLYDNCNGPMSELPPSRGGERADDSKTAPTT